MGGDITTFRDGIETRLKTINPAPEVYDHVPVGVPVGPSITIQFAGISQISFSGSGRFLYTLTLRLAGADPQEMWKSLDDYLALTGTKSIRASIDGDKTLGGTCDYALVPVDADIPVELKQEANGWWYEAEFPVEVVKT